jgi:hypothetical protein
MHSIGFDFGSVYAKAVLLDAGGKVDLTCYAKKGVDDRKAFDEFFNKVGARFPGAAPMESSMPSASIAWSATHRRLSSKKSGAIFMTFPSLLQYIRAATSLHALWFLRRSSAR